MGVSPTDHGVLIDAIGAGIAAAAAEDRAVIDAVSDASEGVSRALSWGRDPADARQDLGDARDEALDVFGGLIEESRDLLPPALRGYVDRAIANAGLDSPWRLLNLAPAQRDAMLQLQHERDRVLCDARQRVRPQRLQAAGDTFETQARALLTRVQQAELDQLQANIAANLDAVMDREMADYPAPEDGTDRTAKGGGPGIPQYLGAKVHLALNRWLGYLRAWVASPTLLRTHHAPVAARGTPKEVIGSASPGGR